MNTSGQVPVNENTVAYAVIAGTYGRMPADAALLPKLSLPASRCSTSSQRSRVKETHADE
jgi:hypothetical protein